MCGCEIVNFASRITSLSLSIRSLYQSAVILTERIGALYVILNAGWLWIGDRETIISNTWRYLHVHLRKYQQLHASRLTSHCYATQFNFNVADGVLGTNSIG